MIEKLIKVALTNSASYYPSKKASQILRERERDPIDESFFVSIQNRIHICKKPKKNKITKKKDPIQIAMKNKEPI